MTRERSEIKKSKKLKFINPTRHVIPAQAGIQEGSKRVIPAFTGMTG